MSHPQESVIPVLPEWSIGGRTFRSRLLLGTSNYPSPERMIRAMEAGQAEIITVSIRKFDLRSPEFTFLSDPVFNGIQWLPNTSGCYTAAEAVFTAELAREAMETNWIKVEVIGDERTLMPDPLELLHACESLVKAGFIVLPYCPDDPVLCRRLQDLGCAAVMPLAAPIGTGLGIRNPHNLQLIRDLVSIPVIVDAGIGTASDAALAMELGCDAILLNTAVAEALDPVRMALAMRLGIEAGLHARLAGRIPRRYLAKASSPLDNTLFGI